MGWNCFVAFSKCIQHFGGNAAAIGTAIAHVSPGGSHSSCRLTMLTLGRMISPGETATTHAISKKAQFMPSMAVAEMSKLVNGDDAIFVSISPDHHFTILPLSNIEVGLFQGFQDTYNLYEWISRSGKTRLYKAGFLSDFEQIFSKNASMACNAAVSLFAIPGEEGDIEEYYKDGGIFVSNMATASVNMFSGGGGNKAQLGVL